MKNVPGIQDVAKKAGVSITTVSKALNDYSDVNPETRQRIREIAEELNYVPNAAGRTMGGKADKVIGLLINDLKPTDPSGAVYGILSGVCHACQDNGIEFILLTTDGLQQQQQQSLKVLCLKKQLTGLICSGFRTNDRYLEQLGDIDIPCAFIDMRTPDSRVMDITIDNSRAAFDAVRAAFNRQVRLREDAVAAATDALEAAFDFMERAFPDGQEMVVFLNELALGPDSAPFLADNECERFERYSQKLLLHAGQDELLAELERDDVRAAEHSTEF